jgi:hypothetical protein
VSHVVLVIGLRPGLAALSSVISVLHARLADVGDLTYTPSGGGARLEVACSARGCRRSGWPPRSTVGWTCCRWPCSVTGPQRAPT